MNTKTNDVNNPTGLNAPLRNLALLDQTLLKTINRPSHLPGMTVFYGPSGFGKSTAAGWVASKHTAIYVEVRSIWNKKNFLEALCVQLGLNKFRTNNDMLNALGEELAASQSPVLIDEFDNAVDRNLVETVRDLYEMSQSPFVLIGEESLPGKLERWERFHGRILEWAQAQPADIRDARQLNNHYIPDVRVCDDLLESVLKASKGSVRRIVTNLERVRLFAKGQGISEVNAHQWGNRELYSGKAPAGRRFV